VGTTIERVFIGHGGELRALLSIAEHFEEGRFEAAFERASERQRST